MSQTHTVRGNATSVRGSPDSRKEPLSVVYHSTEVVKVFPSKIILNTGGWRTATTRTRMNQTSSQFGLGFQVFQKAGEWFVSYYGNVVAFRGKEKVVLLRQRAEAVA